MREDHGVPVVVAYLAEYPLALFGREVLLARVEDFGHRVSGAERPGYFVDVGFQTDNHGFVGQPEALLLVGPAAHDQGLSAAYLVVDDPAAEQLVHPYRVLLAAVQVVDAQPLEVEVGERLVRPVVLRAHVAVEGAVIEVCQAVFEVGRLLAQPLGESAAYLVDLAVGELYGLPVAHLDLPAFSVHPPKDGLGDVGRGVLQGVLQQVQPVVLAALRADGILLRDLHVRRRRLDAIFV